jgi:ABC-type multidrug transport system permease subunit
VTKAYLSLIAIDLKLATRQRAVIFFNYLFPLMFFFMFGTIFRAGRSPGTAAYVLTMSVTLGILGNGFFGAGIRAIQEREMNILRRYKVTPITPAPLLVASMVTGWLIFMPLILMVMSLNHFFYHMPWPQHMPSLLVFVSLGLVAFRSMGLVIASVANSMQEGTILVQLCYLPMLFLSGATLPAEMFPPLIQGLSKFIPSHYLVEGVGGMILRGNDLGVHWKPVVALLIATVTGLFLGIKLFRWEKDEKIQTRAKLWIVAVLVPFVVLGAWQVRNGEVKTQNAFFSRRPEQKQILLITGAKVLVDGKVIESGSVLQQGGKVIQIYEGQPPDPNSLKAQPVSASGKTVVISKGEIIHASEIFDQ